MDSKQAWQELTKFLGTHNDAGGTQRLEELVLSLYNGEDHPCDLGRVIGGLDQKRFELVLALLKDYNERGESDELLALAERIIIRRQSIEATTSTEG